MNSKNPVHQRAHHNKPVCVFIFGLTIKHWWRVDIWLPIYWRFFRMTRQLTDNGHPCLSKIRTFYGLKPVTIQYWQSLSALRDFAQDQSGDHVVAWGAFNTMLINAQRQNKQPSVGLWHVILNVSSTTHLDIV